MTDNRIDLHGEASRMREDYLRRLDEAIGDLPHRLALELRSGIAEELSGLDTAATAQRIAELGDPRQVAAAAVEADREGSVTSMGLPHADFVAAPQTSAPLPPPAQNPLSETRGYAIVGAILLGIGGFVVPFVGWVVGAALVTSSKLWRTREKVWAILFPFIAAAATGAITALTALFTGGPNEKTSGNPLLPNPHDLLWSLMIIVFVASPLAALWLVLRLRNRITQ